MTLAQTGQQPKTHPMTLNVGQIGIGYWGPNLAQNLASNSRITLAAVADRDAGRRHFIRTHHPDTAVVESASEIIDDRSIHAVVIATPARTHFELARLALDAGKHVLVEKPMASNVAQVEELGRLASDRGSVLMVGHTFLYNSAVIRLKEVIDEGGLGELRYISSVRVNLGRIRSNIDVLWNLAPHDISIIQYLIDDQPPRRIVRKGMDYIQPGIEDVSFLHLEYPNQVMAHVHVSWLDPRKVRRMTVVGSQRMVVYDDLAEYKLTVYDKGIDRISRPGGDMDYDDGMVPAFTHRSGGVVMPAIPTIEPLRAEINHWLDCIIDGVQCRTGPEHAAGVVSILERAEADGHA